VFNHVVTHRIDKKNEYIPTCLEVGQHKVTGKVLVCLAVQRQGKLADAYDHWIIVYEFDQKNKYRCSELVR